MMAAKPRRGCWPPRTSRKRVNRRHPSLWFVDTFTPSYKFDLSPEWRIDISLGDVLASIRKGT